MAPSPLVQVQQLERALTRAPADPNPLLGLLSLARDANPEVVHKAAWALYRAFGPQIAQGRVGGITGPKGKDEDRDDAIKRAVDKDTDAARAVKAWIRDRLLEFVDVLGGMLHDAEPSLRTSGLKLLFGLLPPLSVAAGVPVHTAYFRILVRHLICPSESLRGAHSTAASSSSDAGWKTVGANQEGDRGVLPQDVAAVAVDEYWAKYDDLRLFFFREAAALVTAGEVTVPSNLLNMIVPLVYLPTEQDDLNAFFIPGLATPPTKDKRAAKKSKKSKSKKGGKKDKELDAMPDWMAAYEDDEDDDDEEDTAAVGGKRARTGALGTHAAVHSLAAHTAAFTAAWEAVLSFLPLDTAWTRRILAGLHGPRGILQFMAPARRVRVADWLGGTVDGGGAEALLAMNGLFVLMTQYNLDYPNFYERLYALLDGDILHARYRARFFRLLDTFLRSPLLPAALIAAFIKRLGRLALAAPPAGVILVVPFTYNLFKRHPGTMAMLHRLPDEADEAAAAAAAAPNYDPYDPTEPKPALSRAIDSSVWELAALERHYLSSVATLSKIYSEQFTKPEFSLEDFLDHGYATLFETEAKRKIKTAALSAALELGQDIQLFPKAGDSNGAAQDDVVGELWAF